MNIYFLVGESSGKPSTCIVKNVEGEVGKTKKELTELQRVKIFVEKKNIKFYNYFFNLINKNSLLWNVARN